MVLSGQGVGVLCFYCALLVRRFIFLPSSSSLLLSPLSFLVFIIIPRLAFHATSSFFPGTYFFSLRMDRRHFTLSLFYHLVAKFPWLFKRLFSSFLCVLIYLTLLRADEGITAFLLHFHHICILFFFLWVALQSIQSTIGVLGSFACGFVLYLFL